MEDIKQYNPVKLLKLQKAQQRAREIFNGSIYCDGVTYKNARAWEDGQKERIIGKVLDNIVEQTIREHQELINYLQEELNEALEERDKALKEIERLY